MQWNVRGVHAFRFVPDVRIGSGHLRLGPPGQEGSCVRGARHRAIAFGLPYSRTHTQTIEHSGAETTVSGTDCVAVGAGGAGALRGLITVVACLKQRNIASAAMGAAAFALGAYHIARGLFLL